MGKFRIALAQAKSSVGTADYDPRDDNMARALPLIRRASQEKADLVMFGEMFLSGYRTDEFLYKYATVTDPPDAHVSLLIETAEELNIYILIGAATFGKTMPGDIYNSALLISPEGLVGIYRKTHVAAFPYSKGISTERCFYSPGKELPVFDTALGRLGIHICYDMSFPEVSRVQTIKGADILLNISASAAGFEEFWVHGLFMRAVENATWYVVCSVVGEQRGDVLFGGSRVIAPTGQVVAEAASHAEDFVIADIDTSLSRDVRGTSHLFNTRNPGLYTAVAEQTPYP
jgi:predicted amidohydrolase